MNVSQDPSATLVGRHAPLASWVGAGIGVSVLVAAGSAAADRWSEWVAHGFSHLAAGLPLAGVAVAARRWWPPARAVRPGQLGRRVVLAGLGGMIVGQLLEIAGARVDEPGALAVEALAHTAGQITTMLSMLVLLAGGALSAVAATRDGALPRWAAALLGIAAVGLVTVLFIGTPGA